MIIAWRGINPPKSPSFASHPRMAWSEFVYTRKKKLPLPNPLGLEGSHVNIIVTATLTIYLNVANQPTNVDSWLDCWLTSLSRRKILFVDWLTHHSMMPVTQSSWLAQLSNVSLTWSCDDNFQVYDLFFLSCHTYLRKSNKISKEVWRKPQRPCSNVLR
jgi:hypothetical protein